MNIKFPFVFILVLGATLFTSCGASGDAKKAEKYANEFYRHLKSHNYDAIIPMLDVEALKATPVATWKKILSDKEVYGDLMKAKKNVGFSSSVSNGNATVALNYTVNYTNYDFYEKIWFVKRGQEYKIWRYEYNEDANNLSD